MALCAASQATCAQRSDGAHCAPCEDGSSLSPSFACEPLAGEPIAHDFPEQTIGPGEEIIDFCRSWTLHNDDDLWINAVELRQSEDSHHANFVFVPESMYDGPDGIWPRADRGYDFYDAATAGGILYAQSTQAAHEVQRFAPGAAVRIPPRSRVISDIHLLNTSSNIVKGHARLTLYTLPPESVTTGLRAFHVEYDDLHIAPHSSARFTGRCEIAAQVLKATGEPFAPKIHYLLPHTHAKATAFFAEVLGGPSDGLSLLDLPSFNGEAHGRMFDPPVDLGGSLGLSFGCQYANSTGKSVGWGIGNNEMCELFGFAEGSVFFQSRVKSGGLAGADGSVELYKGDCVTEVLDP